MKIDGQLAIGQDIECQTLDEALRLVHQLGNVELWWDGDKGFELVKKTKKKKA